MARITKVTGFQPGFIYDVSQKVGPTISSANVLDDVMLVQLLLHAYVSHDPSARNSKGMLAPSMSGTFDAVTGFWIYEFQARMQAGQMTQVIDGWLSPCGSPNGRHSKGEYMIYRLNRKIHEDNPARYPILLTSAAALPPALKALVPKA